MDKVANPYAPGAGHIPPELAGRGAILERADTILKRSGIGRTSKGLLLVGLRGVGKTVLLNRIIEEAGTSGFNSIAIEADESKGLARQLATPLRELLLKLSLLENANDKVKSALRVLASFVKAAKITVGDLEFSVDPAKGTADTGDFQEDLPSLLTAVAEASLARQTVTAIVIDEMQFLKDFELRALIVAAHKIVQRNLPLVVFGAGLPQLLRLAGDSREYAERLFDFHTVGPLSAKDAEHALQRPAAVRGVRFEKTAIQEIIKLTEGYPYFLQEWGSHCWDVAKQSPITLEDVRTAHPIVLEMLDQGFFKVRFDRVTPEERLYLRAMADIRFRSPKAGEIAELLTQDVSSLAPIRDSLIKKGMIYNPEAETTAFTVPLFGGFMKRAMKLRRRRKPNPVGDLLRS